MKGLLLKEFYFWLKTRSFYMLAIMALIIYAAFESDVNFRFPYSIMGVIMAMTLNSYMLDEKSGWSDYAKALPCTPFQRVTAKYLFHSCEYMFLIVAQSIAAVISSQKTNVVYSTSSPLCGVYAEALLNISLSLIALALCIPACILIKGNKKYAVACIPLIFYIFIFFTYSRTIRYFMPGWVSEMLTEKTWVYPVTILASLGILAISWMLTVMLEAGKDKVYFKKYTIRAAAAGVATLALCGASVGVLYFGGSLPDPTFGTDMSSAKVEKAKEELYPYYDFMCIGTNIGKNYDELAETLKNTGFDNKPGSTNVFLSDSQNMIVSISTDKETNKIKWISASSTISTKIIEGGSDEDFKKIGENFTAGMTEAELHKKIKELELIPSSISEKSEGNGYARNYYFKFTSEKTIGGKLNGSIRSVSVKVLNGVISDVELRSYKDGSTSSLIVPSELEARDEMRALLNSFCNTNHLENTVDDNMAELEYLGFIQRGKTNNLTSASGSLSANVEPEEETGLTDFIYISGKVGEFNIKSATTEDLNKICENFPEDMSEADLVMKFEELGVVPHEILESINYEKRHLRNYEVTYTLESYNGGEGADYEINIDVIDGKVYDVRTYIQEKKNNQ